MNPATQELTLSSEAMPLGDGLTVTFTLRHNRLQAEWAPRVPVGRKGRKYLPAYRRARDEFLRRIASRIGANVGVVEL